MEMVTGEYREMIGCPSSQLVGESVRQILYKALLRSRQQVFEVADMDQLFDLTVFGKNLVRQIDEGLQQGKDAIQPVHQFSEEEMMQFHEEFIAYTQKQQQELNMMNLNNGHQMSNYDNSLLPASLQQQQQLIQQNSMQQNLMQQNSMNQNSMQQSYQLQQPFGAPQQSPFTVPQPSQKNQDPLYGTNQQPRLPSHPLPDSVQARSFLQQDSKDDIKENNVEEMDVEENDVEENDVEDNEQVQISSDRKQIKLTVSFYEKGLAEVSTGKKVIGFRDFLSEGKFAFQYDRLVLPRVVPQDQDIPKECCFSLLFQSMESAICLNVVNNCERNLKIFINTINKSFLHNVLYTDAAYVEPRFNDATLVDNKNRNVKEMLKKQSENRIQNKN